MGDRRQKIKNNLLSQNLCISLYILIFKIDFAFALLKTNNDLLLSIHSCKIPPGLIQWFIENEHIDLPLPFPFWLCKSSSGPNISSSIGYLKLCGEWVSLVANKLLLILVKLNWLSRTGLNLMAISWPLISRWSHWLIDLPQNVKEAVHSVWDMSCDGTPGLYLWWDLKFLA